LESTFKAGLAYDDYVRTGKPEHQQAWADIHARGALTDDQRTTIGAFMRRMRILVSRGTWCGDCIQQLPFLDHIERASDMIEVRYVDRDEHIEYANRVQLCGGLRVPVVVFMNEDWDFMALFGDRCLSRYRAMAQKYLGPACPVPGAPVPDDEIASQRADWVNECERVHLMLRMSTKLRERYSD
ncbi:MAG: thioredoxin family protein, partial [Phycisphaerales bacterium]|nr:thioredoxin family protein [Phycisphaerales bacterium]